MCSKSLPPQKHPAGDSQKSDSTSSPTLSVQEDCFARVASFYDELMDSIPYIEWADYVEKVMRVKGFSPKSVIDVACGTGTVAMLLARRGYRVVGTDYSAAMIEKAQEKTAAAGLEIPYFCQNASELRLKEKFDLAICLYDSLNYILEDDGLLKAFRAIRKTLVPGGVFLFDLNTLYSFQEELFTQSSLPGSAVKYRWKSEFDPFSAVSRIEMYFEPPEGTPFTVEHRQRAYLVEEVARLLKKARFELLDLFEAYTLLPPGRLSERIFYLAQRKEYPKKRLDTVKQKQGNIE